jgi:hypothetical protein
MITRADLESIISAVPSFQAKWNEWQGTLGEPISVEFSFYMSQYLVERASAGDFTDFTLLFSALEGPLSDPNTELYDALTMGFLEDLIRSCEQKGISLQRVTQCIDGESMRREWQAAYYYTHATKNAQGLSGSRPLRR